MEHRRKPTIIKLHEHLHRGTETMTDASYAGLAAELSFVMPSSFGMEDGEISDLQWLVDDFDLRTVCLYDIDGQEVAEVFRRNEHQDSICKVGGRIEQKCDQQDTLPNSQKRFHPSYHEMITRCLKEEGEVPVRDIYKWISERFPEMKLFDATWKNKVRYTLTTNPLFNKKKSDFRKCNVWFLDKCIGTKSIPSLYPKNFIFSKSKRISSSKKVFQTKPRKFIRSDEENIKTPSVGTGAPAVDFQQSTEIDFATQCWFLKDVGMYDSEVVNNATGNVEGFKLEPVEYYELEIPIVTEYLMENDNYQDPIGVKYLLEESSESMSLEI